MLSANGDVAGGEPGQGGAGAAQLYIPAVRMADLAQVGLLVYMPLGSLAFVAYLSKLRVQVQMCGHCGGLCWS